MNAARKIFSYSMIFQGLAWVIFSMIVFSNKSIDNIICILMITNGICFFILAFLIDSKKIFKISIFLFLLINLILTITDQMGFYDYMVLVLNILSLSSFFIYAYKNMISNNKNIVQ